MTAKFTVEIEFTVSGSYFPAVPATPPSASSGGDPPEPETSEVETINDIKCVRYSIVGGKSEWLLDSFNIPQVLLDRLEPYLLSNDYFRERAEDAIIEDAKTWA